MPVKVWNCQFYKLNFYEQLVSFIENKTTLAALAKLLSLPVPALLAIEWTDWLLIMTEVPLPETEMWVITRRLTHSLWLEIGVSGCQSEPCTGAELTDQQMGS